MTISKQKTSLFFRLSISVTVFCALFKFMPSFLIIVGAIGMVIFLGIQFYQKQRRLPLDYARLLLIVSFSFNYGVILFGLPYGHILTLITKLLLISFLVLYIKKILFSYQEITQNDSFSLPSFSRESLSYILADLATVYIVIASLFKILHWEFGMFDSNVLLAIGLFTALISILASSKELGS